MRRVFPLIAVLLSGCFVPGPDTPDDLLGSGSRHAGAITRSETWLAKDNPHVVAESVFVNGSASPVLTIEAGVVVRFEAGTSLIIGRHSEAGALVVKGTAEKPVRFIANDPAAPRGHYAGIELEPDTTSVTSLAYLEMDSCGASGGNGWEPACLGARGEKVRPKLDHVRIVSSSSVGIAFEYGAAIGAGSSTLVVEQSENESLYLADANGAPGIPAGSSFAGVIRLGGHAPIEKTQSWGNHGVPYLIEQELRIQGSSAPTLTLAAGTHLRFGASGALSIGEGEPAALKAEGSTEAKIVFTAHTDEPYPGHWGGLRFGPQATPASRLTHAIVEYAGRNLGQSYPSANVQVQGDKGAFIKNTVIRDSGACGVLRVDLTGGFPTDFTAAAHGNVFERNAGGNQCDD